MTLDLITWQGQKCKCFLSVFYDRGRNVLECALGQQKSQITRSHRTHAFAGNSVIFSAEVVRYHVRFL